MNCDFSGWATRANVRCADGRTILKDAFKHNDGQTVPLVWNHEHNDPANVLGHALLENRDEGVYAYCTFNGTESGQNAKKLVEHSDICALSIYANQLKQKGSNVVHGAIREVSLVLAGANPGAYIEAVTLAHGELSDEEAIIYNSEEGLTLRHADEDEDEPAGKDDASKDKTVKEVFDTLNEEQKNVVYALIGEALGDQDDSDDSDDTDNKEEETVKHNVFDGTNDTQENTLTHDAMTAIINDGKRYGSLKESFLQHAGEYGIADIDYLFPDAKNVTETPEWIKRETDWVQEVIGKTHHTPFSRIKSIFADITADEARAKGYIKGNLKKEEVFSLLKRTTTPQTVYKKQKLDRDDIVDITDFDVVAWMKGEMRIMLDEEIARAILVGDGRLSSDDDKISEDHIRPIWTDADLYTIKAAVNATSSSTEDEQAKAFIRMAIKSRKDYKGSGNPTLFTTEDVLTNCLLLEDSIGRVIYDTEEKLRTALRVKEIVTVPVMEDLTRTDDDGNTQNLMGIIVNLADYNVGADKGGAVSLFDDFDLDYNRERYLIETRCSGALIKPYSAIVLELPEASA